MYDDHRQKALGGRPRTQPPKELFELGTTVATPGALAALEQVGTEPVELIARHLSGDWGEIDEHDKRVNQEALASGGRLFSAYTLVDGTRIWVITESDRSITTILMPSDY